MAARSKSRLVDVAAAAGVSPATVSRALSQPELLASDTLAKVRASALELGYRPDAAARTLASGRSMAIGAVMPTLDNAIFAKALQAMQTTLAAEGFQLLVASHDYSAAAEMDAVRALLARGIDGLMLVGAEHAADTEAMIAAASIPTVMTWCAGEHHSAVTVDNERAGALAAQHLLDLGHRVIGMVTGGFSFNDRQRARMAGVRQTLQRAGLDLPDWRVSQQPTTLAGGRSGCAALLELADPPTALIGGIDLIAIGCMVEAQSRGLQVPQHLSVVGIDDLDMSAHLSPSLTTVHVPTARIGADAAAMLLAIIRDEKKAARVELLTELVVRRSSGPEPSRGSSAR